jgi:hypothetical protein
VTSSHIHMYFEQRNDANEGLMRVVCVCVCVCVCVSKHLITEDDEMVVSQQLGHVVLGVSLPKLQPQHLVDGRQLRVLQEVLEHLAHGRPFTVT